MNDNQQTNIESEEGRSRGFFASLLMGLVRDAARLIIACAVGTGAGAIVCWYYDIPLIFSLAGGILVLVLVLALYSDGLLS